MNRLERLRSWLRGPGESSSGIGVSAGAAAERRRTRPDASLPMVLAPWSPGGVLNAAGLPRPTPQTLRRFAEVPAVRRAINVVKDRIVSMEWQVRRRAGTLPLADPAGEAEQLRVLRRTFQSPNAADSFRTFAEQVVEDALVGGFGAAEIQATGDAAQPFQLWPVDGSTIQVDSDWSGDAEAPRYRQQLGLAGGTAASSTPLLDRELLYMRLNARTHTALGLGRVEVAFDTVNQFLEASRFAGRLASNSVVQYALWLDGTEPTEHERMVRWWRDEVEGSGEVPVLSTASKPEVLRFGGGTDAELRLQWQEFLLRMIANAFDLPPMFLGVQGDVNRSTAAELSEQAFQTAVLPVASLFAEHLSRDVLGKALGLHDYEFVFTTVARDEAQEVALQVQLLEAGVLSVDEVRAMRGLSARG